MQDPLQHLPGYVLRRTSAAMMAAFAGKMDALGLRTVDATIVQILATTPGLSQSALGRILDIQRANMTPIAARLEARGLVRRSPSDGRSLGLELTEAGRDLARQVEAAVSSFENDLLAALPEADRAHLLPALKALWAHYAS
ncbi:MAG: MarR family winged helix-turn-helix transcriptional regulator [Chakrabartia sp.]